MTDSLLAIAQPLPVAAVATLAASGADNLLSPNPREVCVAAAAGDFGIVLDLGSPQWVDTFFLGYTNLPADTVVEIDAGAALDLRLGSTKIAHSYRRASRRHAVFIAAAPVLQRYVRFVVRTNAVVEAGVAAVGLSIRPGSGHEWGAGRPIADTAQVSRLPLGGFGIGPGATAGGWQWTMPALTDAERDRLYALALDVGIGGTILVAENTDATAGQNERLHWGLLAKLEPFGRQAPDESKWSMQVQDW